MGHQKTASKKPQAASQEEINTQLKPNRLNSEDQSTAATRRTELFQHYHKRSNVKSTFSMMKRKFGDGLRSKTDVGMVNETVCKILCHNLVVLIHEMCELGIDPVFWPISTAV